MRAFVLLTVFLLGACAEPVALRQYLLEAPNDAVAAAVDLPEIGVREIAFPLYARRPQVPVLTGESAIESVDEHRWADDPARAATRLIARRLARIGGGEVYAEPWPLQSAPAVVVAIEVDRMIGALGGETVLSGDVILTTPGRRADPRSEPFEIRVLAAGDEHLDLVGAYAAALARLADEIAALIARG